MDAGVSLATQRDQGLNQVQLPRTLQAQVNAAAQRFAALPAATRHAWLAAHLAALRAGHLTLAQLP